MESLFENNDSTEAPRAAPSDSSPTSYICPTPDARVAPRVSPACLSRSLSPICGAPDETDFISRTIVLDAILLETIECRANHLQTELIKQQRERGICPYTLVLRDE